MAKADYILCDRCDAKIVYDGEGKIAEGIVALGLDKAPVLCEACRTATTGATDIVDRLKRGNLDVSGSAASINALLRLHRDAAEEIGRLRGELRVSDELTNRYGLELTQANERLRGREIVIRSLNKDAEAVRAERDELRSQYEHLDGLWRKLVDAAGEAGHVNGEGSDFAYLLMSLRMGPPDRYRTALGRIAGMEMPHSGWSQMVGMMKQIARNALEDGGNG